MQSRQRNELIGLPQRGCPLQRHQCPSQAAVADSSRELCVCVCRLIKATAATAARATTQAAAAAAVTQLDQLIGRLLRMPPKG